MPRNCPICHPGGLHQPARLLGKLHTRGLLTAGPDLIVVVARTTGEVVGVSELPEDLADDWAGDLIAAAGRKAGLTDPRPAGAPDHTAHLVRRRNGRTVPRPREMDGWTSWLNACSAMGAFAGEWLLVTQHGWRSLLTHSGPAGTDFRLETPRVA